jgi:cyclase
MKRIFLVMLIVAFSFDPAISQEKIPDLENVRIITTHVAGPVYMLEATGDVAGNIAVSAGPDGILLVDTQFAPLADSIRTALDRFIDGNIEYIINTHHHTDHTHGNANLGKSAIIIGHSKARTRLSQVPEEARPKITFNNQISIHFNDEEIKVIHYPHGHTDNDVVVFFTESNVVHLGDLWNSGISSFPTVDLEAGGSIMGMLKNIEDLIRIIPEDAHIIPGHYALSDLRDLKRTREMLVETIGLVKRKKAAGMSLEKIKKEGFPAKYDGWGTAYTSSATWIENIYHGLEYKPNKE